MKSAIASLKMLIVMTIFCGLIYPLAFTGIMQVVFPYQANGSIIEKDGKAIGSELIGQEFKSDLYFSGRPSANEYDAANSAGTNYGAINADLKKQVEERTAEIRKAYNLTDKDLIPSVMVLNSAPGFDPHMTPESMYFQVKRVAAARNLDEAQVKALVDAHIEQPTLGFMGDARVNVLKLNMALDELSKK